MNDVEYAIAPGQRLEIRLPQASGGGYLWDVEALDPAVVRVAGRALAADGDAVGAHTVLALEIEGVAPGATDMEHRRPWLPGSGTSRCTVRCA